MDELISINEALAWLKEFTIFDLFNAAKVKKINILWGPGDDGLQLVEKVLTKMTDLDDIEYMGYRAKDYKVIDHQFGPFYLDVEIEPRYEYIFNAFKNSLSAYEEIRFGDPTLLIRDLEGKVFAIYTDGPIPEVPEFKDLLIRSEDLASIRKTLKSIKEGIATNKDKITYIRSKLIKAYIKTNNLSGRFNESAKQGKSGFQNELLKILIESRDAEGKYIFSKGGESILKTQLNKDTFNDAYKKVKTEFTNNLGQKIKP